MADYNLDFDEGIIIETEGVHRSGNGGNSYIKKMLLTNKNIIYVTSQKTGGMFSKSVDVVDKIPLSEVKVINGQVFVTQKKTDLFEYALQIQFVSGIEEYSYSEGSKKITNQWVSELHRLLGNGQPVQEQSATNKSFLGGLSDLASSIGTMAGTLGQSVSSAAKQAADQAGIAYENARAQMEAKKQEQAQAEAAFKQTFALQQQAQQSNPGTRQEEFAGTVLKCPNCGAVISQTTVVCPECGHRITGQAAVSSVKAFSDKLMMLETRRKGPGLGQLMGMSADPVDKQKLALIQSFPIPNTIDDIQEFMLLAIANIDVALSKNTMTNRSQRKMKGSLNANITMPRTISDAWVAKMQQAYQKAAAYFPNEPAFAYIKQLYVDKMKELKMKIDD